MPKMKPRLKKPSASHKKIGLPPGTPTYTGNKGDASFYIGIINYTKDQYECREVTDAEDACKYRDFSGVTWIDVNGLNTIDAIQQIGNYYQLHPLILEDIADTHQRPKIDEYEKYIFVVFKMLYYDAEVLRVEHICMVLGNGYVLTFQEAEKDVFDPLRARIKEAKGRVRTEGADYLFFAIIDAIVDHYYLILEELGDKVEAMEADLFADSINEDAIRKIQNIKKEALIIRRSIFPLREVLGRLDKTTSALVGLPLKGYYHDLYDHAIQIIETVELSRDMIWGLADIHMSAMSNRMNRIMKVLTIIATIFIPLTFIVGVYGMNFHYMPELDYKYGYLILWIVMILIFLGMIVYFKRKKWL